MARRQLGNLEPQRQRRVIRIGGPLTSLLDERFMTQAELAKRLRVHEQNVSRWCRNETGPQKRRLRQIARVFDVEPGALIDKDAGEPVAA